MSYKYFYLLILFGISSLTLFFLLSFYFRLRNKEYKAVKNTSSLALVFLCLALFSWVIVVIGKFFDNAAFSLLNIVNDRLFSTLSNLFFVLSVNYLPSFRKLLNTKFKISTEQWLIGTLLFFSALLILLSLADKMIDALSVNFRNLVIIVDSLISIGTLALVGMAFYTSSRHLPQFKFLNCHLLLVFVGLSVTQILLPCSKIIPDLLAIYYPYFLALFLVFLCGFFQIIYLFFSLELIQTSSVEYQSHKKAQFIAQHADEIKTIYSIAIDASNEPLVFTISIAGLANTGRKIQEQIVITKITQPMLYWCLFAISKQKNTFLYHPDMAVIKFRITELWNKNAKNRITQEVLFTNENSRFQLATDQVSLATSAMQQLKSNTVFKNLCLKHYICFISDEQIKLHSLINRKKYEAYAAAHFDDFLNTLL